MRCSARKENKMEKDIIGDFIKEIILNKDIEKSPEMLEAISKLINSYANYLSTK